MTVFIYFDSLFLLIAIFLSQLIRNIIHSQTFIYYLLIINTGDNIFQVYDIMFDFNQVKTKRFQTLITSKL